MRGRQVELLKEWLPLRDTFLDEMVRLDGRGDFHNSEQCSTSECNERWTSRCIECFGSPLLCDGCLCASHIHSPLHRVQRWTGSYFKQHSLLEAGLTVQLGHDGLQCPTPRPTTTTLTVIDISGIHKVLVKYCDCGSIQAAQGYIQLLRARWWPATLKRPGTVVTLRTCELFHALTLQGKMNAYDFWNGLVRITDNTGLRTPKDHYKDFIRIMRCFRNIRLAKRGGRAHEPGGIAATGVGELVVECPACPHPGVNLPEGWKDVPKTEAYYAVMLAIDANFKLKSKNRGLKDVDMAPGWSYFVENESYQEHVRTYIDQDEMKHCESSFAAVDHANMPAAKRFAVNGVGAVICARHCFYRKSSVGDLQRGERYCNMDYILLSTIARTAGNVKMLVLSYDIACQFSINFLSRMAQYPEGLRIKFNDVTIIFVIPKFHILGHGEKCQLGLNINTTEGLGRTCGEGIESGWAETNGAALSTREMSPASRRESLDDFFGAINWRKTITLGKLLTRTLKQAMAALADQKKALEESNDTIPAAIRARWEESVTAWDADRSLPNPYREPGNVTTLLDVRLELAKEEAAEVSRGVVSLHEMSASVFLSMGIELEDLQRGIRVKAKDSESKTPAGKLALHEKRTALQSRVRSWRAIQQIYMPAVAALQAATLTSTPLTEDADRSKIEDEPLYLPSAIPGEFWSQGFSIGLIDKYRRLRLAQAEDALHNLRRQLRIRAGLIHYKHVFVDGPGQKSNTRARSQILRFKGKIDRHVAQYRAAYAALLIVWPDGPWTHRLQELKPEHVRAPKDDERRVGEGHRVQVWIWKAVPHEARDLPGSREDMTEEEVHEGLRVDWLKERARVRRWDEEVKHLQEEMPRAVRFLQHKAEWWRGLAQQRPDAPTDVHDGLKAYAARHAAMYVDFRLGL
ncbi:hypothetical protein FA95DRAFT_1503469 [Auriscalpium vulgare]|uniref:Uncharacterized protein n=1 Tax=Auriscalpium vulgare TaxID=40419 RepID=A0ACB8R7X1_9AGAM|nr:hypothetical protein FA95DRAFT_1503469 [Auriscalpium vulgare]